MNFTIRAKAALSRAPKKALAMLRKLSPFHFVLIAGIIALGIFNAITGIMPHINQQRYERGIEKSFNRWWQETGADQFKAIGLEPTEKIRLEEFTQFRERALAQKPSYIVEDQIENMKKNFVEWWEVKGGKEAFAEKYKRYPDEKDFHQEQAQWIDNYTDKFFRYNMAYVPQKGKYDRLLTSWILFPSAWSFVLFATFFLFTIFRLEKRWKKAILWGAVIAVMLLGGIMVTLLTNTSFFNHYNGERYMGMSLVMAFLLGATAFAPRKGMVSQPVSIACFAGIMLDMMTNWFVNPGIFGAVTVLSPVFFGAGALAGIKIETRKKTKAEQHQVALEERARRTESRNPMAELRAKNRALIEAGFSSAKGGQLELAQRQLSQAMTQLLQEHPVDGTAVKALAERMTNPTLYIEVSSNQWLEWGETAKAKNSPEAAILFLKKGLSCEKNANFARRALYVLGETCVMSKIEVEDGLKRLKKVIEMNPNDILAKQCQRILDVYGRKDSTST